MKEVVPFISIERRFQREGRWDEIRLVRDRLLRESKGRFDSKSARRRWVYSELERMYPAYAYIKNRNQWFRKWVQTFG